MKLKLTLEPNRRCEGCGAIGYVEEKMGLCLACCDFKVRVWSRQEKLRGTAARLGLFPGYNALMARIAGQLRSFGQGRSAGKANCPQGQ